MKFISTVLAASVATLMASSTAFAAASAADLDRLGKDLTPIGAEKAGNKDGSIPAWDGGLKAPAGWSKGQPLVDPFASEKPLLTITAANADQYKDKLSAGELALLKKYPNFKIPVYPTHRTAGYTKDVYDKTKAYGAKVSVNAAGVTEGFEGNDGLPFPIAKTGLEFMYNEIYKHSPGFKRAVDWLPVRPNGEFYTVRFSENNINSWGFDQKTFPNHLFSFYGAYESPATLVGTIYLAHDPIYDGKNDRQAWIYNAGQRRVRRAPDFAYDNIDDGTEGMCTSDQYYGFNGKPDRYDWKYLGKKEMYVAYNTYRMADKKIKYSDIAQKNTVNADLMRYELHRVHVIEATLKSGMSHVYAKRMVYLDEDSYLVALEDTYDGRGNLWRATVNPLMQRYDGNFPFLHFQVTHDLTNGQYIVRGIDNEVKAMPEFGAKGKWADFQLDALRRSGTR